VRVGYFRNKHEAIPLLRKLRGSYPNGFIVKISNIKPENFSEPKSLYNFKEK
jgi:hypothetical protein